MDFTSEQKITALMHTLMCNIDKTKICTRRPLRFQENGAFVTDCSVLRDEKDRLITDIGSFTNCGQGGRIFTLENCFQLPRRRKDKSVLGNGDHIAQTTY